MKEIILKDTDLCESKIVDFSHYSREAIFYTYQDDYYIKYFLDFTENKKKTLLYLDEYRPYFEWSTSFLIPEAFGVINKEVKSSIIKVGYQSCLSSLDVKDSWDLKISLLSQLGMILKTLEDIRKNENILTDFFIGDLHDSNILIDKEKRMLQICDLDSCKIKDNMPYLVKYFTSIYTGHYLMYHLNQKYIYQNGYLVPNQESDLFCYVVIIFRVLFNVDIRAFSIKEYYDYLEKLYRNRLPMPLYHMFEHIYLKDSNVNNYQYLNDLPSKLERKIKWGILW